MSPLQWMSLIFICSTDPAPSCGIYQPSRFCFDSSTSLCWGVGNVGHSTSPSSNRGVYLTAKLSQIDAVSLECES